MYDLSAIRSFSERRRYFGDSAAKFQARRQPPSLRRTHGDMAPPDTEW